MQKGDVVKFKATAELSQTYKGNYIVKEAWRGAGVVFLSGIPRPIKMYLLDIVSQNGG
ncbi:MAG: hypothetical protein LBT55_01765 [Clostridiaceae bacterium]|jgi:hypothetical protein|nr:hypothetical protein [Clostridiaceae bacterium]